MLNERFMKTGLFVAVMWIPAIVAAVLSAQSVGIMPGALFLGFGAMLIAMATFGGDICLSS